MIGFVYAEKRCTGSAGGHESGRRVAGDWRWYCRRKRACMASRNEAEARRALAELEKMNKEHPVDPEQSPGPLGMASRGRYDGWKRI